MSKGDDLEVGKAFAVAGAFSVLLMLLVVPAFVIHGWVITVLWGWFVVPTFGLAPLSIPVAIGLEMLVLMLRPIIHRKDKEGEVWHTLGQVYLSPFVILGTGYIAHLFAS